MAPLIGEYERTSTTVLNSYLRPEVERYVTEMAGALERQALRASFYLMQANAGAVRAADALYDGDAVRPSPSIPLFHKGKLRPRWCCVSDWI